MKDMDNMLAHLFPEEPFAPDALRQMQERLMTAILAQPVDFAFQVELAKRKKLGVLLAGCLLLLALGFFALLWLAGPQLKSIAEAILATTVQVLDRSGITQFLAVWAERLGLLWRLRAGLAFLWQEYSWQATGSLIILALFFEGWRERPLRSTSTSQ